MNPLISALLGLLFLPAAWAYSTYTDQSGVYVYAWDPGTVPIRIQMPSGPSLLDGSNFASSVQAATQEWNDILGVVQFVPTIFFATSPAQSGSYSQGNNRNEVVFDSQYNSGSGRLSFDSRTLAITITSTQANHLVEADIVFNTAWGWDSYPTTLSGHGSTYDVRRVAIHELGHVLGLDHPDLATPPQSVTAIMNSTISDIYNLQVDDVEGGQSLYGAPGAVPTNNNFLNATRITMGGSSIQLTGSNIAATQEAGEPIISGADAPNRHSVWWKWTAPNSGSTTVTTLGSDFDTILGIYTGDSVSALALVAANDDAEPYNQSMPNPKRARTSSVTFNAAAGTSYYIAVDGWGSAGQGATDTYSGIITLNLSTTVVSGDFNGDSHPDLIWQNSVTGDRYLWLMNGTAWSSSAFLGNVPVAWQIAGAADFDGDGHPDLIWQNTVTGDRILWLMDGAGWSSSIFLGNVAVVWQIAAAADFNGDGHPDLVWQNTGTGDRVIWLMDGAAWSSTVFLGNVPVAWEIAGAADLNGGGKPDLIWQNTSTGDRALWRMNGTAWSSSVFLGNVPVAWQIVGAADFNGDGQTDLIWQDTASGDRYVWLMNGSAWSSSVFLGNLPVEWQIRD